MQPMKAALPPSWEKPISELATLPPLANRGSWAWNFVSNSCCSSPSTSRIVPRSKPVAANSASGSSTKISTMALPRPHT